MNFVGDNSLDAFLGGTDKKLVIDGDANDVVMLDGIDLSNNSSGTLPSGVSVTLPADIFGDGELYVQFFHSGNNVSLYIHESLVDTSGFG